MILFFHSSLEIKQIKSLKNWMLLYIFEPYSIILHAIIDLFKYINIITYVNYFVYIYISIIYNTISLVM